MDYYLIIPDSDIYDCLSNINENSLDILKSVRGQKLGDKWPSVVVNLVKMKRHGDFPSMSGFITFSEKAWQSLKSIVKDSLEILPLQCKEGNYYVVNIHEKASLDLKTAEVDRYPDGRIVQIIRYAFKNETVSLYLKKNLIQIQ